MIINRRIGIQVARHLSMAIMVNFRGILEEVGIKFCRVKCGIGRKAKENINEAGRALSRMALNQNLAAKWKYRVMSASNLWHSSRA